MNKSFIKNKNYYLFILVILITPFFINAQVKTLTCGTYIKPTQPEIKEGETYLTDRFGNIYTEEELKVSKNLQQENHCQGGIFTLNFETGFTEEEEETICAAFQYLSTEVSLGVNGSSPIISIRKTTYPTTIGGSGVALYYAGGCLRGESTINDIMMTDSPRKDSEAGILFINDAITQWHTIDEDPFVAGGELDLFSVALHEGLHILGCGSHIQKAGNAFAGRYTPWDELLFNTNINDHLILSNSNNPNCCKALEFNSALIFPNDLDNECNNNIFMNINGNNIAKVHLENAGDLNGQDGNIIASNILSHLECNNDPTIVLQSLTNQDSRRVVSSIELEILNAIGYITDGGVGCKVLAGNDVYNFSLGSNIPLSFVLENDVFPNNFEIELKPNCGTALAAGANVNLDFQNSVISINNLPTGTYTVCYTITGCNGDCSDGLITILNYPQFPDCDDCANGELFCYGSFDDFSPRLQYGIYPELGFPICVYENQLVNSPDLLMQPNGSNFIKLSGGFSNLQESIKIPLTPGIEPGCNIQICMDVAAGISSCIQNLPRSLEILGTNATPCANQGSLSCANNPTNCIASTTISNCTSIGLTNSVTATVSENLTFENRCFNYVHDPSNDTWEYLVITRGLDTDFGVVYIDNVSITSDCCDDVGPPCLEYEFNSEMDPNGEGGSGAFDSYTEETDRNCEGVIVEYCPDGTISVEIISEEVNYVKLFIDNYGNQDYLCTNYNKPCVDTNTPLECDCNVGIHTYQIPPGSQLLLVEISYSNGEKCRIQPPAGFNTGSFLLTSENDDTNAEYILSEEGNDLANKGSSNIIMNQNNTAKNTISVFPNPAREVLNLKNSNVENFQVEIFNSNGTSVLITQLNRDAMKEISLDKFHDGIYFIKFTNLLSKEIKTKRLVIIK
ncbi:MAG: T9SS type A sorting domain-containing protein [Saprospiraceae bacterium]